MRVDASRAILYADAASMLLRLMLLPPLLTLLPLLCHATLPHTPAFYGFVATPMLMIFISIDAIRQLAMARYAMIFRCAPTLRIDMPYATLLPLRHADGASARRAPLLLICAVLCCLRGVYMMLFSLLPRRYAPDACRQRLMPPLRHADDAQRYAHARQRMLLLFCHTITTINGTWSRSIAW